MEVLLIAPKQKTVKQTTKGAKIDAENINTHG